MERTYRNYGTFLNQKHEWTEIIRGWFPERGRSIPRGSHSISSAIMQLRWILRYEYPVLVLLHTAIFVGCNARYEVRTDRNLWCFVKMTKTKRFSC